MTYHSTDAVTSEVSPTKTDDKDTPGDITDITGSFGKWQIGIFFATVYLDFVAAISNLSSPVLVPNVKFTCDLNSTYLQILNGSDVNATQCRVTVTRDGQREYSTCKSWTYDLEENKHSYTEKFNMVCEASTLQSLTGSVTLFGDVVACIIFGYLADRFGRRFALRCVLLPAMIGALLTLFAPDVTTFFVGRFLAGASGYAGLMISFVLLSETTGVRQRQVLLFLVKIGWSLGGVFVGLVPYLLQDIFLTQIVFTCATALLTPVIIYYPESPRWLLLSNKEDSFNEATDILRNAAKRNNKDVTALTERTQIVYKKMTENQTAVSKNYNYLDLFRTPNLRITTLAQMFIWGSTFFMFYGLSLNSALIGNNPFFSFMLMSGIEIPALFVFCLVVQFRGAKSGLIIGHGIAALVYIVGVIAGFESGAGLLAIFLLAKFLGRGTCPMIYNYSMDAFPTVVRSSGLSICSLVARIFAVTSPYVSEMAKQIGLRSVLGLFAALSFFCAAFIVLLPDTHGKAFPETLDDGEKITMNLPKCSCFEKEETDVNEK